jgi:hypothetical protein
MRHSACFLTCLATLVVHMDSAVSQTFQPGQYEASINKPNESETMTLAVTNISGGQQEIVIAGRTIESFDFTTCKLIIDVQSSSVIPTNYNQSDLVNQRLISCKFTTVPPSGCSGISACRSGETTLPPSKFLAMEPHKICVTNSSLEICFSQSTK